MDCLFFLLWPAIHSYFNLPFTAWKWLLNFLPRVQNFATNKISVFSIYFFLVCDAIIYFSVMKTKGLIVYYNQAYVIQCYTSGSFTELVPRLIQHFSFKIPSMVQKALQLEPISHRCYFGFVSSSSSYAA